jgi:hypothetical protein
MHFEQFLPICSFVDLAFLRINCDVQHLPSLTPSLVVPAPDVSLPRRCVGGFSSAIFTVFKISNDIA